jgi:isopentenyl-diphosphate delta-isomerase
MRKAEVILVNEYDEPMGIMEKMQAHQEGLLHRAFSVFIFDHTGNMLVQQRAGIKYHGAYLWTNACCSHPFPGEEVSQAAFRRLLEELGFSTPLQKLFSFTYRAEVENGLVEYEFDHVFGGIYDGNIHPNPHEVAAFQYVPVNQLTLELEANPEKFTVWFRIAFPKVLQWWQHEFVSVKIEL